MEGDTKREASRKNTASSLNENKERPSPEDSKSENKSSNEIKTDPSVTSQSKKSQTLIEDPFGGENAIPCEEIKKDLNVTEDQSSNAVEDDGEDLPDNFFDDFSNNDFMAGLDIVDDWIDENVSESSKHERNDKKEIVKGSNIRHERSPYRSYRDRNKYDSKNEPHYRSRRRSRHSKEDDKYSRDHRRRSRSRNKRRSRSKHNSDKNPNVQTLEKMANENTTKTDSSKERNSEGTIDRRRDPEKTKRDIQRDKIRCAKDQEARVFQEQLKVAETGLVPPGTELDVVLNSDKFKEDNDKEQKKSEPEMKKENKSKEDKEITENKKDKFSEKRKAERPRSHSRERRPRRSPIYSRQERDRSYSPKRRRQNSRSRERERRRRSRSRRNSRDIDLRYRLKQKRERNIPEFSPVSDKRLSRSPSVFNISPESLISEREMWIRGKSHQSRSRYSKSCSPVSSVTLSDRATSPKRHKKYSFMEELEIKLRRKPPSNILNELPSRFNIPPPLMALPVPNPQVFIPQAPMQFVPNSALFAGTPPAMCPPPDPFQHQMIMGHSDPNLLPHIMGSPSQMMPLHPPNMLSNMPPPGLVTYPLPQVPTPPNKYDPLQGLNQGSSMFRTQSNLRDCTSEENQELEKLFEDKKISLSDFLSVSAKTIDSSCPVSIHNKIKVISRCQETIKLLEDPKLTGRFFPKILHQAADLEKRVEKTSLNQSPMRKAIVVRFNFTIPVNKRGPNRLLSQPSVTVYLHKVLSLLGLSWKEPPTPVSRTEESYKVASITVPKPVPLPAPVIVKKCNMVTQTDPVKCQICEIRSARKFTQAYTQTVETSTFDAGTQVSIEDLNKSCTTFVPRGILKNSTTSVQSISHLTPAQLLAQLGNEKKEDNINKPWSSMPKKESFPSGRSYADHLPGQHFSSENNSRNMFTSSNNDRFNDSYRNINPFSDSYTGGDNPRNSLGMFSGNSSSQLGKGPVDGYGSSYSGKSFSNVTPEKNRSDFSSAPNRVSNFGLSQGDPRNFDSPFNAGRRFSDNVNSNFVNWNTLTGRGNPRGLGGNLPMSNNNFFNQRGPN